MDRSNMTPPATPTPTPQPTSQAQAAGANPPSTPRPAASNTAESFYTCARKHCMPTHPKTLADYRFNKCLFAADKATLLRIYGVLVTKLNVSSRELREWAATGPQSLGRNIWVELSTNARLVPREYLQFVADNQRIWDLENELRLDAESGSEADEEDGQDMNDENAQDSEEGETIILVEDDDDDDDDGGSAQAGPSRDTSEKRRDFVPGRGDKRGKSGGRRGGKNTGAKETNKRFIIKRKGWVPLYMRQRKSDKEDGGEKRRRGDSSDEGTPKPSSLKKAKTKTSSS